MQHFLAKLKYIFLPYLVIGVSIIMLQVFLYWLLVIKLEISVGEVAVNISQIVLCAVLLWFFLRPVLKGIAFKPSTRDPYATMLILHWMVIAFTIILAQNYLVKVTGKLTRLNNISQIDWKPKTKYYTASYVYASKPLARVKPTRHLGGKNRNTQVYNIFVAVPLFDEVYPDTSRIRIIRNEVSTKALVLIDSAVSSIDSARRIPPDSVMAIRRMLYDTSLLKYGAAARHGALVILTKGYYRKHKFKMPVRTINPAAWVVFKYEGSISAKASDAEKKAYFNGFYNSSYADFRQKPLNAAAYFDRLFYNDNELQVYRDMLEPIVQ